MKKALSVLAANLAHVLFCLTNMNEQDAGGGKQATKKNVDCILKI
jgi:hypothetical protein